MKTMEDYEAEEVAANTQDIAHSCLEEAAATVKQRREVYGEPNEYFMRFADLLSAYLEHPVSPEQSAMIMLLGKVARLISSPTHRDSCVDIAGYLDCYARVTGMDK